jgi:Mrp family chromosome partitioning ATPase
MEATEKIKKNEEQENRLRRNLSGIKNKLVVLSGKGGVGKTTVAVNLAYGLAMRGEKVGLLDTDIHGPNVAKMLGLEGRQLAGSAEGGIEPVTVGPGLKIVSMAFLLKNSDQPVIWRGPMKMMTIKQFLSDVVWGDLDYLIVDSPPGTGDEPLSVCQLMPDMNGAIVVTTPQEVAVLDSRKCVSFAKELGIPVIGMIENMSGFICPHCSREIRLFGTGGGERAAVELKVPFLGRIPLEPGLVVSGDVGEPFIHHQKGSSAAAVMSEIMNKIAKKEQNGPPQYSCRRYKRVCDGL